MHGQYQNKASNLAVITSPRRPPHRWVRNYQPKFLQTKK